MSSFENLRIVDNFYQTSLYFPMPTVIISTLCEDGSTTLGPYSLVQPYYVAGKDYYAMLLCCRNSSNTFSVPANARSISLMISPRPSRKQSSSPGPATSPRKRCRNATSSSKRV